VVAKRYLHLLGGCYTARNSTALKLATLVFARVFCAGCGASGYQPQNAANSYSYDLRESTFALPRIPGTVQGRTASWMKTDATNVSLLYISSAMSHDINVFSFPQGKPEGLLTGINLLNGICSDAK
jgi:hypothetical protein